MITKFAFPAVIAGLVIVFFLAMISQKNALFTLIAVSVNCIAISCLWLCVPLKRVQIDEENLYISNYINRIMVPISQIQSIKENIWFSTHPIWITFKLPTEFGEKIMFMPTWCPPFTSHQIVEELQNLKIQCEKKSP